MMHKSRAGSDKNLVLTSRANFNVGHVIFASTIKYLPTLVTVTVHITITVFSEAHNISVAPSTTNKIYLVDLFNKSTMHAPQISTHCTLI